jgi:hypothetical protein
MQPKLAHITSNQTAAINFGFTADTSQSKFTVFCIPEINGIWHDDFMGLRARSSNNRLKCS